MTKEEMLHRKIKLLTNNYLTKNDKGKSLYDKMLKPKTIFEFIIKLDHIVAFVSDMTDLINAKVKDYSKIVIEMIRINENLDKMQELLKEIDKYFKFAIKNSYSIKSK
jgi:hypothetical protein